VKTEYFAPLKLFPYMVISLWYLASRVTTRNGGKVAMPLSSLDVQIDGLSTVCIVYRLFNVCYQVLYMNSPMMANIQYTQESLEGGSGIWYSQ